MNYQLNLAAWSGMFALPCSAMDHMREASGNAVKVLLTVLSASGNKPTPEQISSIVGISVEDATDGLKYWVSKGILTTEEKEKRQTIKMVKPGSNTITSKELAEQMANNDQARYLFDSAELLYARPLNAIERKTLLYIYQSTLLPVDVIIMIIDFCLRIDKQSINYMLKVCESWAEQEINTHEKADAYIRIQLEKNQSQRLVLNCFGIHGRKLSKKENDYIDKWLHKYSFEINMIRLAYERTVDAIGELSFAYINEILTRWNKNNITTPEQASNYDTKSKPQKEADNPSYDLDKLSERGMYIPEF